MSYSLIVRALITWALFIPIAILNGTFRQFVLNSTFTDSFARQVSCFTGSGLYLLLSYFMLRKHIVGATAEQLLLVGLITFLLTIFFETGMGLVAHHTWNEIFYDYNVMKGRLWGLVLITVFLSPWLVSKFI